MIIASLAIVLILLSNLGSTSKTAGQDADGPQFTSDNRLLRPVNYRNWVFLSTSLGLQYGPGGNQTDPAFENVYVNPPAYKQFVKTGKWPDQTIFVLEIRRSMEKGSFARGGRYQGELAAVEAAVKDEGRFPEKWAYFGLGRDAESAKALPKDAGCFSCHSTNAAVENSFAQFYPTVFAIAKEKGTLNPNYLKAQADREAAEAHAAAEKQEPARSEAAAPKTDNRPEEEVNDLVCNMQINKKTALKTDYKGTTYYFCSKQCKDDFDRAPLQFIKPDKK